MKYNNLFALYILTVAVLALIANSFYITPLTISDADPSTYIIIPILMLPLLAFFLLKKNAKVDVKRSDIGIGIGLFVLYIVLTLYLWFSFSYLFISFRVDLLLLPLVLAALVGVLFGFSNINKFQALFIYLVIASPIIMFFIFPFNQGFAVLNTIGVYSIVKLFIVNAVYTAPITITANGYNVGIGQTCVGIGALLALVFLLIPVAYFYNGTWVRKILWIASGFVLLLVLNFLRMTVIAMDWFVYGPNSSALLIHESIGILLFYISIVVMVLLMGRYGLRMPKLQKSKNINFNRNIQIGIVVAVLFVVIYALLSLDYINALYVSPANMYKSVIFNVSKPAISHFVEGIGAGHNYTEFQVSAPSGRYTALTLFNKTINSTNPIAVYITSPNKLLTQDILTNSTLLGEHYYLSNRSVDAQVYYLVSNNTRFFMYHTQLPYPLSNNSETTVSVYVLYPAYIIDQSFGCKPNYQVFFTDSFNLLHMQNSSVSKELDTAYCLGNRLIG